VSIYTDPATPLVALSGGSRHGRWFFYRDWLELRVSSRRLRHSLYHPSGFPRCYLPTDRMGVNPDPDITAKHGRARVWEYVPPEQWARWGKEYLAPEERPEHESDSTTDLTLMEGTS
jgi:hypothetical protein